MPELAVDTRYAHECIDICYGFFSPIEGFMGSDEVESVCKDMSLPGRTLWSIPITMEIGGETSQKGNFREGGEILLTYHCESLAILKIGELFQLDTGRVAGMVYGTTDSRHPDVRRTVSRKGKSISGEVTLVSKPEFQPPSTGSG